MAALRAPSSSFLAAFFPVARASLLPHLPQRTQPILRRTPLLSPLLTSLLPAVLIPIPSILGELWDGLLRAVPKKKTSHSKKRHRQMAGKALKDVTALNKCSACGRTKRAHVLCPYCVQSIRQWFGTGFKTAKEMEAVEDERMAQVNEELRLMGKGPVKPSKKDEDRRHPR